MSRFPTCSIVILAALSSTTLPFADGDESAKNSVIEIVKASDVEWQPLNPARGDHGPKAGTLWGDQTRNGASGFLVEFIDGFSSPPHIHNITYRGVVIDGSVHNDDPGAVPMWMAPGSFWTQPAGEVHITSARGERIRAFIEIESGPYLVMPPGEAFDRRERPINVDASNLVWLGPSDTTWIDPALRSEQTDDAPQLAFVWGTYEPGTAGGVLVKLPAGCSCKLTSEHGPIRCVVIAGELSCMTPESKEQSELSPGSYFGSSGSATFVISNSGNPTIVYVRTNARFGLSPVAE